ncbi:hypothetical protein BDV32DRAFT_136701 [Aspergillus pseudonomiae]|uniref:Rhodopsin domain-containing protein n=1 Tax=Aspergillus pseudonomiae TaxID=1506151 RepID=A0A5N6I8I1_9EURO|nr:uncharacterized protein BDV37DRAFT_241843 [Aspergillus pseudonomiae]KAB8262327.1 hypothetical protein BDV32DRAFT_136701 [Aspergillus pseudonomiae]KAE8407064.1 hypothetical protein BDV37DRAFT_241843 [Aspergillus pseudonomiae]
MGASEPDGGPALRTGIWVAMALATLIVVLRVFAKLKIGQFRVDDILMIIAMILAIVATVFLTLSVSHGFGKNLETLPLKDMEAVLKAIAIEVPIVTMSTTIARCSFIIYLLAILGSNKTYRFALWFIMIWQLSGNIVSAVLPLSICRDVRILWDPTVKTTCGDSSAVIKFAYYSNTVNSATDLFLAVFPIPVFWNLNLKTRVKLGLIVLLSLGLVAMVASIVKTTKLDQLPSITNLGASGGIELIRWGYVETAVIIITSSIPCIRPLVMSSVKKFSSHSFSRSYELHNPFSGNRRTGENATTQSRRKLATNNDAETCSIERILNPYSHNTVIGSHQTSSNRSDQGITKQVEMSVYSSEDPARSV